MILYGYCIAIVLLLLFSAMIAVRGFRVGSTIKAGKVDKFCFRIGLYERHDTNYIEVDGQTVKVTDYEHFIVRGNSMSDFGIRDGQEVYVRPYSADEKLTINTYPIIAFEIINPVFLDSRYKLRKFVSYIDLSSVNWEEVYEAKKNRIRPDVSKHDFIEMCTTKASKYSEKDRGDNNFVLSETYDEECKKHLYSLHPVNTIHAAVKYIV